MHGVTQRSASGGAAVHPFLSDCQVRKKVGGETKAEFIKWLLAGSV